jgi:lysosomal alpha-mannosidase
MDVRYNILIVLITCHACQCAVRDQRLKPDDIPDHAPNADRQQGSSDEDLRSHNDRAKDLIARFLKQLDGRNKGTKTTPDGDGDDDNDVGITAEASQCGYEACDVGKDGFINVHLVPHTHDDVGWLKTVDQYYYDEVQYILDTVIDELLVNPTRRFIYVEMAFFSRWWHEQDDHLRHVIKGLVNKGQLEFILGGWCMNDEASTHYSAIIDQHTLGFRFLKTNFGECGRPKIGWQIDPFGHSREQASLFAQFGFDGQFFARLDYQDRDTRIKSKTMEMMWRASQSLGDQASLFTGVLYNGYGPPDRFCFECGDAPMMDDLRLEDYNVEQRVKEFLAAVTDQAKAYSTNNLIMTFGSDFQYQNARVNFKNIDKLIHYVNQVSKSMGSNVNVFYSTPSCYLYAVNKANLTYTHKEDDFFPYASSESAFWTGYFTSRAALKGYERVTNNFFQVCRQLDALTLLGAEHGSDVKLRVLRDAMGVVQHHDGVSGTEKQHVAYDYAKRLSVGTAKCQEVVNSAYSKLLPTSPSIAAPTLQFCSLLNISYCTPSETNSQFAIVIYNPFGRTVSWWARIPVSSSNYVVIDAQLKPVPAQIVPLSVSTMGLPDRKGSTATGDLVFLANLPALGFNTYFVKPSSVVGRRYSAGTKGSADKSWVSKPQQEDIVVKNEYLSVTFSGATGLLKSMTSIDKALTINISQNFLYYLSHGLKPWPPSGAYLFRPINSTVYPITSKAQISLVQGSQVQEVRQVFGDWASQVVRLYNGTKHLEVEWTIGPIPTADNVGKEVISLFSTSLESNAMFYTDSNGREILQRIRDYRPTWKLNQTEPVAGNYYPVNSRIFIQDTKRNIQLTILNDRSQGGASIKDGDIELMLHRRLIDDDNLGVGEPLNETGSDGKGLIIRGKQFIYLDDIASSVRHHRDAAQRLYMAPYVGFAPIQSTVQDYTKNFRTMWSGVKGGLPDNVHLLTLEQWEAGTILLRLEHFYAKDEDQLLSRPATVQLKDLFVPWIIESVVELTLGANQLLSDCKRLQWNVQDFGTTARDMSSFVIPVDPTTLEVVLKPMQIRTFRITLLESSIQKK